MNAFYKGGRYKEQDEDLFGLLRTARNILLTTDDSRLFSHNDSNPVSIMIPILFHLGPLTVYSFGMMMALGFLAADYVIRLECKRLGFDPEYSSSVVITAAVAGIVGSRIYAIMADLPTYLADPKSMIFSGSGFVFYGVMIGRDTVALLVLPCYALFFVVHGEH